MVSRATALPRMVSRGRPRAAVLSGGVIAALGLVVVYPVVLMFVQSLQRSWYNHDATWTLAHYAGLVRDPLFRHDVANTLVISLGACLIATTWGVILAWIVARTDAPWRRTLHTLNLLPFFLNSVVGAAEWEIVASPHAGVLNTLFGPGHMIINVFSRFGIMLVIGLFYVPYAYLFTLSTLQGMDPVLEEAAVVSGAGRLTTALRVTLPLAMPAILSSAMLIFITSAGLTGVPLLLGTPAHVDTLSTAIYGSTQAMPPDYNRASAVSSVLFLLTVALMVVEQRVIRRRSFVTVTGKGYRPAPVRLGRWGYAALAADGLYLAAIFLPLVVMLAVSFQQQWVGHFQWRQVTLRNYTYILFQEATAWRGFKNSAIISFVGATVGVVVCSLLAYVARRSRLPGRTAIEFLTMVPVTLPGIVLGVGFLMAWVRTPMYGTLSILLLAYIVQFLPFGVKNTGSLLLSVSRDLEESALMAGGSWWQSFRHVTLPLLRAGLLATWLLLFVAYFREVGASIILYLPGLETVSVALIRIMEYDAFGVTAAFAILQTVVLLIVVGLFNRFVGLGAIQAGQQTTI